VPISTVAREAILISMCEIAGIRELAAYGAR
jgi:hypothetical protein